MADKRGYGLTTLASYDGDAYLVLSKSGWTEAKNYKLSSLKTDFKVGDQTYTEQNYVTDAETLTDSVDALDVALAGVADNISSLATIKTAVVSLDIADILALNSVPYTLVAAPGSDKMIELLSISAKLSYATAAYVSANEIRIKYSSLTAGIAEFSTSFLTSGSTVRHRGSWTSNVIMKTNEALQAYVPSANPTTGGGTIKFYITYRIITETAPAT